MKQPRLAALLLVMVALLALRWWQPPEGHSEVVQAVERPGARFTGESASPLFVAGAASAPMGADLVINHREPEAAEVRNAFAPRVTPPPPPPPAPPAPPVAVAPVVVASTPPVDPAPPPPPLQIIGAWKDERGASVFIAGPSGVVQARAGDTVLAEYNVTQITPQQVQLRHLPTQRDLALAVPPAAAPTLR